MAQLILSSALLLLVATVAYTENGGANFPPPSIGLRPISMGIGVNAMHMYISEFTASAREANDYCRQSGFRLLAIETAAEQLDVTRAIAEGQYQTNTTGERVWTCGSDEMVQGRWIWTTTQQRILYSNFNQTGDSAFDRRCITVDPRTDYKWLVEACSNWHYFVCEY